MRTPSLIEEQAARKYPNFLRAWLQNAPFFPLYFPVGALPTDYLELQAQVTQLRRFSKAELGYGYSIEWYSRKTQKMGNQTLPQKIIIETQTDFLALLDKTSEFSEFTHDVALLRQHLPTLESWLLSNPLQIISQHAIWPELILVCQYFAAHPRPNLYPRELPIAVDTKFIERYQPILRLLLDALLPPETIETSQTLFERRFGLRYEEPLIRLRFLDSQFQKDYNLPIDDISLPLSQFASMSLTDQQFIVVENKLTFLTLPPLPRAVAIFGSGFRVELLSAVAWLAACPIFYWGDLDAQGFQILAGLRANFPHVVSILMDEVTLTAFEQYGVRGTACNINTLPHLTAPELAMFTRLAHNQLRLEQERIAYNYAKDVLRAVIQ